MYHYPKTEKHLKDQWADPSRISSSKFKNEWQRIFGERECERCGAKVRGSDALDEHARACGEAP